MSFSQYKARAKKKGLLFTVDKSLFDLLVSRPCYFCRINKKEVGIDRLDNSKGYQSGNCIPCCWDCNRSKSDKSVFDYREYLLRFNPLLKIPKTPLVVHWIEDSSGSVHTRLAPFGFTFENEYDFYRDF